MTYIVSVSVDVVQVLLQSLRLLVEVDDFVVARLLLDRLDLPKPLLNG